MIPLTFSGQQAQKADIYETWSWVDWGKLSRLGPRPGAEAEYRLPSAGLCNSEQISQHLWTHQEVPYYSFK